MKLNGKARGVGKDVVLCQVLAAMTPDVPLASQFAFFVGEAFSSIIAAGEPLPQETCQLTRKGDAEGSRPGCLMKWHHRKALQRGEVRKLKTPHHLFS